MFEKKQTYVLYVWIDFQNDFYLVRRKRSLDKARQELREMDSGQWHTASKYTLSSIVSTVKKNQCDNSVINHAQTACVPAIQLQ